MRKKRERPLDVFVMYIGIFLNSKFLKNILISSILKQKIINDSIRLI